MRKKGSVAVIVLASLLVAVIALAVFLKVRESGGSSALDSVAGNGNVIEVEILNGCGKSQLVIQLLRKFREKGFDVKKTGNADNFNYEETIILDRTQKEGFPEKVGELLNTGRIMVQKDKYSPVDVTVIVGKDYITGKK